MTVTEICAMLADCVARYKFAKSEFDANVQQLGLSRLWTRLIIPRARYCQTFETSDEPTVYWTSANRYDRRNHRETAMLHCVWQESLVRILVRWPDRNFMMRRNKQMSYQGYVVGDCGRGASRTASRRSKTFQTWTWRSQAFDNKPELRSAAAFIISCNTMESRVYSTQSNLFQNETETGSVRTVSYLKHWVNAIRLIYPFFCI
jgi:hypothetical protein